MRRNAPHNLSATSDVMSNVLTESSVGMASSFDEEVFNAHRVVPDAHPTRLPGGSGSDFSPPNSEPFTQVWGDSWPDTWDNFIQIFVQEVVNSRDCTSMSLLFPRPPPFKDEGQLCSCDLHTVV